MSLTLLLDMAASGHGDRIALGSRNGGISFTALARAAAGCGAVLARHDARHVVFLGRNGPAVPQVLFAAAHAGVPFAPLNYRLSRDTVLELVGGLDRPLVIADADFLPMVAGDHEALSVDSLLAQARAERPADPVPAPPEAAAVLLYTSGTTARPKAVVLRHENLLSYIVSTVEFGGADPEEAALAAVPPYHVAAVGSVLSNLYAGRRVVYLPDFDPAAWLRLVRDERITTAMVVPTMLARVVEYLGDSSGGTPALRLISYGGARMPRPVLERALAAFPATGFCNAYGLTETSSTLALLGPQEHREALTSADPVIRNRLASVGRPVPGIEVQVRGPRNQPLPPGVPGEVWVRGPQVSGEYRGQRPAVDADGWFHTRDRGRLDADGYLYLEGRADDTIIRGGENIAPAEIEDVLHRHPAVRDVAVVGRPDDEWGEKIVAVIVPDPAAVVTADELREYVRGRLRGSRAPDDVVWRSELPRTPTGKLLRRKLAEEL